MATCPICVGPAVEIAYGLPDGELMEEARRGEVAIGGCIVEPGQPTHKCRMCRARLRLVDETWEVVEDDTSL